MKRTDLPRNLLMLIQSVNYAAIATVSPDGTPWITPLYVKFDEHLRMYWVSATTGQHSRNIALNGRISVVMYDTSVPEIEAAGLYLAMEAGPLEDPATIVAAQRIYDVTFFTRYNPAITFQGSCPSRMYRARPLAVWHNTDGIKNGCYVDMRRRLG
jgi:hypothetical protein